MDREKTAEKIRQDLKDERKELKKILNEELGLFKNDQEIEPINEKEGEEIRFEFHDEGDSDSSGTVDNKKRNRRKRKEKQDTAQNKPATKFVIDE